MSRPGPDLRPSETADLALVRRADAGIRAAAGVTVAALAGRYLPAGHRSAVLADRPAGVPLHVAASEAKLDPQ